MSYKCTILRFNNEHKIYLYNLHKGNDRAFVEINKLTTMLKKILTIKYLIILTVVMLVL